VYDSLMNRGGLPGSTTLDITHHPVGNALKRPFGTAFAYSDCVVDDSRLVALTALDAAERGAAIRTGARCVRADRSDFWRLAVVGADVTYLCEAASRYFRERVAPTDVVRAISGVNLTPALAPGCDGTTLFHARRRKAPLITTFGGDVTTSRLRAERAVARLTP